MTVEFLTVEPHELKIYDMVDEGRIVVKIEQPAVGCMTYTVCIPVPECEPITLSDDDDGPFYCMCHYDWVNVETLPLVEPLRVMRGAPMLVPKSCTGAIDCLRAARDYEPA